MRRTGIGLYLEGNHENPKSDAYIELALTDRTYYGWQVIVKLVWGMW